MSLQPILITGEDKGLTNNKKPFLLADTAWSKMENGYTFRERVLKREGLKLLGRLQRNLTAEDLGMTSAGPPNTVTFNTIFSADTPPITEPNPELIPGTLVITVGAPDTATFTDNGDGTFAVTGAGVAAGSYVIYATGLVVLQFSALTGGAAITADFNYYPSLPAMGIVSRDLSSINNEQTIWFDEVYAYIFATSEFEEFIPGTVWNSSDSDFFLGYNYRGAADNDRLLFVTNFVNSTDNPMRYTDGTTWASFAPLVSATDTMFTARILLAYYGRMIALNTYEGATASGAALSKNFFNRCRFSQYSASPIAATAWRSDQFGKGGFIDAPTNEAIIGAMFIKNTLVVTFEQSTWQLRYVGEYGLPFIWERVSADFGSESTFSTILFDNHMLAVGDKAIIAANGAGVDRIDLDIPDQIFNFKNENEGVKRVFGIRNYQKEIVYWNYPDAQAGADITFPNKVLLYNYRNASWAIFRDSITCFGTYQLNENITWNDLTITWDSTTVTWDDIEQSLFPAITAGNQQGFIFLYQEDVGFQTAPPMQEEPSLSITDVTLSAVITTPISLTVINHNLLDGEIIYISGMMFIDAVTFLPIATDLNDAFYEITVEDADTINLRKWNFTTKIYETFPYTTDPTAVYIGGGLITLIPKMSLQTKDINLYQAAGLQTKLSRLEFLMQPTQDAAFTVNILPNANSIVGDNAPVWSTNMSTVLTPAFYNPTSDYAWFRYYWTTAAQYFRIGLTYDDALMNTLSTHRNPWTMYAIIAQVRRGGKNVF